MFERKTVVMSFDKPFIKYASIAIHRLLTLNPDWDINCLAYKGQPTGVIYGFLSQVINVAESFSYN